MLDMCRDFQRKCPSARSMDELYFKFILLILFELIYDVYCVLQSITKEIVLQVRKEKLSQV
jgi:hypothetical protein